jgi:malonyl-CoA decarboxylase
MPDSETEIPVRSVSRPRSNAPFFPRILEMILAAGRGMLEGRWAGEAGPGTLADRCKLLLTHRGDASGLALAEEVISSYEQLSQSEQTEFLGTLSKDFAIDSEAVLRAADRYRENQTLETVTALRKSLDPPVKKLFRKLNAVPGGTRATVKIRERLLALTAEHPELSGLEADLRQLLIEWFNRGFLVLDRIDWDSPASVLERIIEYEAVHEINGWEDLHNRLRQDRRCFAFFHMTIPGDPLIFLQVALTNGVPGAVAPLLAVDRDVIDQYAADTAVFYSISNCHRGLRGISFGHFLIKQVVEVLRQDLGNIRNFATLSPIPGFRRWVENAQADGLPAPRSADLRSARELLAGAGVADLEGYGQDAQAAFVRLAAYYLVEVKREDEQPLDSVARFHLANGASIDRLCWAADVSVTGMKRSWGMMVNYIYEPKEIEKNHERYFQAGEVAMSSRVRKLARGR